MNYLRKEILLILLPVLFILSGCASSTIAPAPEPGNYLWFNPDTVKAQRFDTGKMWTFEDAPVDYFDQKYGFHPNEDWLSDVQMSALKFASWCSASFVSADGLIMTNHHCIDFVSSRIQEEGEDITKNGFYAETLEDERPVSGVFVDQLVLIEDVTDEIQSAYNAGATPEEKAKNKEEKINEISEEYSTETGLNCRVIELYNGGKYSLYGYKRYSDIRAVYFNESDMGLFGGDPDNFTYPRYNPDFAFLRAYDENGKPLQTDHFFKWSPNGAKLGEPIFVVGNPGSTNKLKTVAQLEYMRDYGDRNPAFLLGQLLKITYEMMNEYPERRDEFSGMVFMIANSAKALDGRVKGLRDPYLMARKRAFEKEFKNAVFNNPELNAKYGHLWDAIANTRAEMRQYAPYLSIYQINRRISPGYLLIARDMVKLADQLKLPESERENAYKGEELKNTIESIFPDNFDKPMEDKKLRVQADYMILNVGKDYPLVQKMFGGNGGEEAVKYALSKSLISTKEDLIKLANKGAEAILNSGDPFISFVLESQEKLGGYAKKAREINDTEDALENELGRALYAVYGTSIPPDATFTLRISDGMMKGYEYNGTEAPEFTTFYGMYNRYYSHQKKFPWDLPERWLNYGPEFNLETPYNFVSTHDIIGGSSGSPVINQKKEIVGLAFDGNIESLPGDFLYDTRANRMVSVASQGILEILSDLLHCNRLADELRNGKITE